MATLAKGSAFFFFIAFVVCTVNGQDDLGQPGQPRPRRIQVAEPVPLNLEHAAKVAVPIMYEANDYSGPYDPFDPRGVVAALHRQFKIDKLKRGEVLKSYIPPGVGKMAKKEAIKVAVNEGRRFATAHPKETAEIVGIATKAKSLFHTASHKLENAAGKSKH